MELIIFVALVALALLLIARTARSCRMIARESGRRIFWAFVVGQGIGRGSGIEEAALSADEALHRFDLKFKEKTWNQAKK